MEMTKMHLSPAVLALAAAGVLLYPSAGFAQQQGGTSGVSTNTSSQQTQPFQPFFPTPSPTIRITGAPSVQPSPGLRQECTPVEQEVAGLIIGPTDLCARQADRRVRRYPGPLHCQASRAGSCAHLALAAGDDARA